MRAHQLITLFYNRLKHSNEFPLQTTAIALQFSFRWCWSIFFLHIFNFQFSIFIFYVTFLFNFVICCFIYFFRLVVGISKIQISLHQKKTRLQTADWYEKLILQMNRNKQPNNTSDKISLALSFVIRIKNVISKSALVRAPIIKQWVWITFKRNLIMKPDKLWDWTSRLARQLAFRQTDSIGIDKTPSSAAIKTWLERSAVNAFQIAPAPRTEHPSHASRFWSRGERRWGEKKRCNNFILIMLR